MLPADRGEIAPPCVGFRYVLWPEADAGFLCSMSTEIAN